MKKTIFHFVKSNYLTGVENVVINICTLVKGYNYTVVSTKGPLDKYLKHYGINHITIPNLNPVTILKVIKKYNPNIVQAHDAKMTVLLSFSGFYCHRHHIRMISEMHNNDPKMKKWYSLRSIIYLLSSIFYSLIIDVSPDTAYDYSYYKLLKKKTCIITNIVNVYRVYKRSPKRILKQWDCVFLGRFVKQKNPLKFIKLIYRLRKLKPNITAIMIGCGPMMNESKHLINKLKLSNNIELMGFQYNPYKYLKASRLLILTSIYEGLPLVALESFVLDVPVISTPLKGLIDILGQHYSGFAYNNAQFISKIFNLLTNKSKYNILCKHIHNNINNINDIDVFIKSYKDIYK